MSRRPTFPSRNKAPHARSDAERGGGRQDPRQKDGHTPRMDGAASRKDRPSVGLPVLYGTHAVAEALKNLARRNRRLHVTEQALKRLTEDLGIAVHQLPLAPTIVRNEDIARLTGADAVHQGVALEADNLPARHLDDLSGSGMVLVLDQITDPHNVGAILRTAAAFAVEAVIVTERNTPETQGVLAKTASGGLEHVAWIEVTNLAQALTILGERGYWRVGLDSEGPDVLAESLAQPPIALVLGAEGRGLRRLTRERCDVLARLDMPGAIKSLNVSNAAAIALATAHAAMARKG